MKKWIVISFYLGIGVTSFAQVGKVGINTNTPTAMLHVMDSSVVFTGTYPLPGLPGNPPNSGTGTRMMWYANKAAFRAGIVDGTQWDKDSIGFCSIAFGQNTKAKGFLSTAFGFQTEASGQSSTALGVQTTASGLYSTAMGVLTIASSNASTSMGSNTKATGTTSTAMGIGSIASGSFSTAIGNNTIASGQTSTAMGGATRAIGNGSTAIGNNTRATGDYSTAHGLFTVAKPFLSFSLGQFNDTTSISSSSWNVLDPVFIIGNGTASNARGNAFTILKSGKTGINTHDPQAMLHIIKNGTSGGPFHSNATTILESNQNSYIQFSQTNSTESGLLSGNNLTSIRSALLFGADSTIMFRTGGNTTRVTVSSNGNLGIGTSTPQKKLHVSNGASGAIPVSTAVAVFEDNTNMTINLLSPNANSSAIEFGNVSSAVHGGIIYNHSTVLNGLSFRTNGNTTKMAITDVGDVGIGTTIPGAKLDVSGTSKFGTNGTILTEVIKVTISKDVNSVAANSALIVDYAVANCVTTSTVFVSPEMDLADGLIIAYARVSAAGMVRVNFSNTTGASINPPSMNYYITVIR